VSIVVVTTVTNAHIASTRSNGGGGFKIAGVTDNTKGMFRINLGLFLAELICIPAFIFEVRRALGGNTLSWAYVFEWPLLAGYAVYMWHKLRQEEHDDASHRPVVFDESDPELDAWNAYLATVHRSEDTTTRDPADD
jgi:hypothetical protein